MRPLGSLVLSLAATSIACTGRVDVGKYGDAVGPEAFTPTQVQAAMAQCNQPHGPAQSPTTVGAVRSMLTASWFLCSTQSDGSNPTGWALRSREFDANGQYYDLGLDAQGGLVRLQGVDNQGTWSIFDDSNPDAGDSTPIVGQVELLLGFDSGGGNGGAFALESSPTRLEWQPDYFIAWYVPIGQ
jgi:hypothetical protein